MNKERLLKIADHLEKGELAQTFDFSSISFGINEDNTCGTHGCALGEFPIIFPEDWEYELIGEASGFAVYPKNETNKIGDVFEKYLGLEYHEYAALFEPFADESIEKVNSDLQRSERLEYLDTDATKEQVARNIRIFVNDKRK